MTQSSTSHRVGLEGHQWRGAGHSGGNHYLCEGREVGNYGACTGNSQYLVGLNCSLLEGRDVGSKLWERHSELHNAQTILVAQISSFCFLNLITFLVHCNRHHFVTWYVASIWDKRLHLLAPRRSTFWHTSIFNLSKLFLARRTCACTCESKRNHFELIKLLSS